MVSTVTDRRQGVNSNQAVKVACYVATDGTSLTLSGAQTVDGISVGSCQRVLVKDQDDASENGIYISDSSTWTRAKDADGAYDLRPGSLVYVDRGTANGDSFWDFNSSSTALSLSPGTDDLTLSQVTISLSGVSDFGNTIITAESSASALEIIGGVSTTSILDPTRLDIEGITTVQVPSQIFPFNDKVAAYSDNSSTIEAVRIADLSRRGMSNSTGNETLAAADGMTTIRYTGNDGSTITLPMASSAAIDNGWFVDVFHDGSTNLFIAPSSLGQTIDGSTQVKLLSGDHVRFQWQPGDLWTKRWGQITTSDCEFVSREDITAATTLSVTGFEAGYDYEVVLEGFAPTDDGEVLWARLSDDGSTFESDAGDYQWAVQINGSSVNSTSDTEIQITGGTGAGNDAGNTNRIAVDLRNPMGTSEKTTLEFSGHFMETTATPIVQTVQGSGVFLQGTDAIQGIQFLWSGGSTFKAQGDITVWRRRRRA